ncbi:MAG: bacteriophage Gp15 family protein [Desulfovibrionaceae bacterium]|nr:bacteriophage Gp15 family protein [Desulfovibrionaceae bacterium]
MRFDTGLPSGFEVGGNTVKIHTGAAFWIRLGKRLEVCAPGESLRILEDAIISWERDGREVWPGSLPGKTRAGIFERLWWFFRGGQETPQGAPESRKPRERVLDYAEDFEAIYAAFLQVYGVDLCEVKDTLHWWKFLALVNSLPLSGTMLRDYYMHYRALDLSTLPAKTAAERKYRAEVARIKRRVALAVRERPEAEQRESWLDVRARELRKAANG